MTKHPNDLKLWQYSRSLLNENELKELRMHILDCPDCMCDLVSLVELAQLEELDGRGELPELDDTEAESILRVLGISPKNAPEIATNPPDLTPDDKGFVAALGIAGLTTAGTSWGGFIASAGKSVPFGPTLAAGHPENFSENLENNVRNQKENLPELGKDQTDSPQIIAEGDSMPDKNELLGFASAPKEFGEIPDATPEDVAQGYADTCAIRAQEIILRDFGISISQEELIQTAKDNGWYREGGGTFTKDVGNLLDHYGVPIKQYEGGNVFSLVNELAQGHKVIVSVDSRELYGRTAWWHDLLESYGYKTPDHALIVSGIDTSDVRNIKVTLTDPGTGDVAKTYSLMDFMNAWEDSNYFMVATEIPAPPTLPEMQNFDYVSGHLPAIGQMDYDTFVHSYSPYMDMPAGSSEFKLAFGQFAQEQDSFTPMLPEQNDTHVSPSDSSFFADSFSNDNHTESFEPHEESAENIDYFEAHFDSEMDDFA